MCERSGASATVERCDRARRRVITVLAVGGTSESFAGDNRTDVQGMLSFVARDLDPTRFISRWVGYPAQYAAPDSFRASVAIGVSNLARLIHDDPNPVVLLGYSQGATVVRTMLDLYAKGVYSGLDIRAAGLISDPEQPPGVAMHRGTQQGYGILGNGGYTSVPTWWIGNDRDPICNAAPDSLLRDLADLTTFFSFTDPVKWGADVRDRVLANTWQNTHSNPPPVWDMRRSSRRFERALREALAYLPVSIMNPTGGQHTSYHNAPYADGLTGCQLLARILNTTSL